MDEVARLSEESARVVQEPATVAPPEKTNSRTSTATTITDRPDAGEASLPYGPGSFIGRYRLLEKIGEGGFGAVFAAEQKEPVKRYVAVKIVKLGMDTQQVVARFQAERQALAMMDHPNIAKVLDGGSTQAGRPYFVMELVRGVPVTTFCDQHHVPMETRLALFIQICHAIQHAHQKGIIHRDIKPSNILLTLRDGVPVPKVIDFGIAKATQGDLTDKTIYTQFRQFIGTPAYMSPEQAEMSGLDIDTRTDIYSLGVVLYQLLVGTTPFDSTEFAGRNIDEMRRTIREKEALRPSSRFMKMAGAELVASAKRLDVDPPRLVGMVRGDLDWIVMKALEKDRQRRYETASSLAMDVRNHLENRPVLACPPSRLYRFRKMARRNRLAFVAASLIVAALVLGLATTTFEYVQASHQRDVADRARASEARARQIADDNAARADRAAANRISQSLQNLIASANPDASKGPNYTVRQLLDDFAAGFGTTMANEPEAEAALQATIGRAYWRLGMGREGEAHLARALALHRSIFGPNSPQAAQSLVGHAWALNEQDRFKEGEQELQEALQIYRLTGSEPLPIIRALEPLANIYVKQSRWNDVENVINEALTEAHRTPAVEYPEIANLYHSLVNAKIAEGEYAEAVKIARESVAMHLRLQGPHNLETGWGYYCLSEALTQSGKYSEALDAGFNAMDIWMKVYPRGHWAIAEGWDAILDALNGAAASHRLIVVLPTLQKLAVAENLYRQVVESNPSRPSSETQSPGMTRALERLEFGAIYVRLSLELRAAGRNAEAAECLQNLAKLNHDLLRARADENDTRSSDTGSAS